MAKFYAYSACRKVQGADGVQRDSWSFTSGHDNSLIGRTIGPLYIAVARMRHNWMVARKAVSIEGREKLMRKNLSQVFSVLGSIAALGMVVAALWYVFGDLPNPLPQETLAGLGVIAPAFRWLFGLGVYVVGCGLVAMLCLAASRIALVGWKQFLEVEREQAARAKKEAIRDVGTLVAVSVENNGLLDSATSMIETTNGFYRVFGRVDVATKGTQVTIRKESRGFFTIRWLCLNGRQFQMTK